MTRQWKRVIELSVSGKGGSLDLSGLKIDFDISKGIGSSQNTAKISIWNLSKSNRKKLGEEYDKIELKAGYQGNVGLIFKGNIRDVTHTIENADTKSECDCGDGDKGVNKGAVSKTFPKGTKPKQIVEHIVGEMPEVDKGQIKGLDDLPAYKRPVSIFGWAFRELNALSREHKFYWSIQNGQFQAVKNDEVLDGTTVLSRETGLVGTPEETDKGVKVKALLNPSVAPGKMIDVRSDFLDLGSGRDKKASDQGGGLFRVSQCSFKGTNRGQEFYVEAEANRVQGKKVVK